eukprot:15331858-Ditylum_brightwellii.AAC.1
MIENHIKSKENKNKKKYLKLCQENYKNFTPFVVTADDMFGQETKLLMKQLNHAFCKKYSCHLSYAHNYVTTMMIIAMVPSIH